MRTASDGLARDAGAGAAPSNVSVVVRVRPQLKSEPGAPVPHQPGPGITLTERRMRASRDGAQNVETKPHSYTFQRVHIGDGNDAIHTAWVSPLVEGMLKGETCLAAAYGFTGTGKSTTIYGTPAVPGPNSKGVALLAAEQLIEATAALGPEYSVRVSMCEVAGKDCRDLLNQGAPLKIRAAKNGGVYVRAEVGGEPPRRAIVKSRAQFDKVLAQGIASRRVGSSTVHDASSRSHAVLEIEVTCDALVKLEAELLQAERAQATAANERDEDLRTRFAAATAGMSPADGYASIEGTALGAEMKAMGEFHQGMVDQMDAARDAFLDALEHTPNCAGRLTFVDLAGNDWEAATDKQTSAARAEHAAINSSLLALKECLRAVAGKSGTHVPFRNSVLTRLISRSFTPGAKLVLFATITPSDDERLVRQSINTLNYARLLA
jgi:hypothetical protein